MRAIGSPFWGIFIFLAGWNAAPANIARAEDADKKVSFVLFTSKDDEANQIVKLLDKVKEKYAVETSTRTIESFGEEKLKYNVLLKLSLEHKIKINQTKRGKSLYTHLVVYIAGEPRSFYPQVRKGEVSVSIEKFLEGLLADKVLTVHNKAVLEPFLNKKQ